MLSILSSCFIFSVKVTGQLSETRRLLDEKEEELKSERLKNKSLADGIKKTLGAPEEFPSPLKDSKSAGQDHTPATRAFLRRPRSPSSDWRAAAPRTPRRRSRSRKPARHRTRSRSQHRRSRTPLNPRHVYYTDDYQHGRSDRDWKTY